MGLHDKEGGRDDLADIAEIGGAAHVIRRPAHMLAHLSQVLADETVEGGVDARIVDSSDVVDIHSRARGQSCRPRAVLHPRIDIFQYLGAASTHHEAPRRPFGDDIGHTPTVDDDPVDTHVGPHMLAQSVDVGIGQNESIESIGTIPGVGGSMGGATVKNQLEADEAHVAADQTLGGCIERQTSMPSKAPTLSNVTLPSS